MIGARDYHERPPFLPRKIHISFQKLLPTALKYDPEKLGICRSRVRRSQQSPSHEHFSGYRCGESTICRSGFENH